MPFREVTRGSDVMRTKQGNRTHGQAAVVVDFEAPLLVPNTVLIF